MRALPQVPIYYRLCHTYQTAQGGHFLIYTGPLCIYSGNISQCILSNILAMCRSLYPSVVDREGSIVVFVNNQNMQADVCCAQRRERWRYHTTRGWDYRTHEGR